MPVAPKLRRTLEDYLAAAGRQPTGTPAKPPPPELADGTEDDRVALILEVMTGHRELKYRGPAWFAAGRAWSAMLASLTPLSEAALCAVARAVGGTGSHLCGYPWRFIWDQAQERIVRDGVTAPVRDALRVMAASMKVHQSDKNAALAIDRALWFETYSKLDEELCAADLVRRDLRRHKGKSRAAWQALLAAGMKIDRAEPNPAWDKKVAKLVGPIDDLDARAAAWLGAIAARDELRLSPAGADALRAVVWATAPSSSPPRKQLAALAARPWKRGKHWGPRHDRFVGAVAWGVRVAKVKGARPSLEALQARFGKTTAKYAIELALAES